jgi:hypothetical protein
MHQATLNDGAKMHLYRGVFDVTSDLGPRLQLKEVA